MKINATFTDHEILSDGELKTVTVAEAEQYLNDDPAHAVIIHGTDRAVFTPELYVLRGASEDLDNFYWGLMPAEDPNDAEGGDLTAAQALQAALEDGQRRISMKDILWLTHSDEVSGTTIFDTGHKSHWTEGRSSEVVIKNPDGTTDRFPASSPEAQQFSCPDGPGPEAEMREMTAEEEAEWEQARS